MKFLKVIVALFIIGILGIIILRLIPRKSINISSLKPTPTPTEQLNQLSIKAMRQRTYPGSDIVIEQTLAPGSNYNQYIASYLSDGLKIYALLTVPRGTKPQNGWPVILFNHGYLAPETYKTTERYVAYVDGFARNGYIVFKPDYRGHGISEGTSEGAYYSPAYTIDVLNALSSIKKYQDTNPDKIGIWGHSMGGNLSLRALVISKDIKAAVIWGGVVGSYNDLINNWQRKVPFQPKGEDLYLRYRNKDNFIKQYGSPQSNPTFWNSIDPTAFVSDISAPVQLDVGGSDEEVPIAFSQSLYDKLINAGKVAQLFVYPGSNHNISQGFTLAIQRSVDFFNSYLK